MSHGEQEEQFVLRVKDQALAEQLRCLLRQDEQPNTGLKLEFKDAGREGTFIVEGKAFPVSLLDLPTVVESYKTYDDQNLVKVADIGQMIEVRTPGFACPASHESIDGVTPSMRDARNRHFRKLPTVDPEHVTKVEEDLYAILSGKAPHGTTFHDIEEEFVVDEATGKGEWRQVQKR